MKRSSSRAWAAIAALLGTITMFSVGCSRHAASILRPNLPPELEIVSARANRSGAAGVSVRWAARDPDGRVDSYRWTLSPMDATRGSGLAHTTSASEVLLAREQSLPASGTARARAEPDLFTVWAVDDGGAESTPATLALFGSNVAPTVTITAPVPLTFFATLVPPNICITWSGNDPDGVFTRKPVKYKFTLLTDTTPLTASVALSDPDSIRRYYAPIAWAGWDSTSSETTFTSFTGLVPSRTYVFAITAFDEAGDYDPVFSTSKNVLWLEIAFAGSYGPVISMWNQSFSYTYDSGGWYDDPLRTVSLEVPWGISLPFSFSASPPPGNTVTGYRWVLDPSDPHDQTPRSDELTDTRHWSTWSALTTACTVGPFTRSGFKREPHKLYIEARSSPGGCPLPGSDFVSLGIIRFVVVRPTSSHEVLIVDDTRLEADKFSSGCPSSYVLPWPSAAELDTFLYARGNVPWRCTKNPTTGVSSPPGVFAGYAFDTLGTRGLFSGLAQDAFPGSQHLTQAGTVPLSVLADYRHVIWLVDDRGAQYTDNLDQLIFPVTALYSMSRPGQVSVLSTYVAMGGKLWLSGGAAAYASLIGYNRRQNDVPATTVFSSGSQWRELGPSRILYDGAHWQSSVAVTKSAIHTFRRSYTVQVRWGDGSVHDTTYVVAPAWSHYDRYSNATLHSPDYSKLPIEMRWRSTATDAVPPTRLPSQAGLFYPTSFPSEYVLEPNPIIEDTDPRPEVDTEQSVLDTLYESQGTVLLTNPARASTMTYYHGSQGRQFVFSGFAIWNYARQDCIDLVDFVLQDVWGLARAPIARGPAEQAAWPALRPRGSAVPLASVARSVRPRSHP